MHRISSFGSYVSRYAVRVNIRFNGTQSRCCSSHFVERATRSSPNPRIFISRISDPYLNLSIEHFLLQKTPPESTVLFLYTNRPCVVIGRNQNPWLEANLGLIKPAVLAREVTENDSTHGVHRNDSRENVRLVRRRSGGGTVFHDEGNVNYCVVCPTAAFDRDKHAEMVTRALKKLGVSQAKVNERHDIVLDTEDSLQPSKVSGSAYKVTRLRSLHHGTCLLSSPNLHTITKLLSSPAKAYLKARGVDSVSSPVANVNVSNTDFEDAVVKEFQQLYVGAGKVVTVSDNVESIPAIRTGLRELHSEEWIYLQTPQFTFSTKQTADDDRERPPLPTWLPLGFAATLTARHGRIIEADIKADGIQSGEIIKTALLDRKVHEINDWSSLLSVDPHAISIGRWLNRIFGVGKWGG